MPIPFDYETLRIAWWVLLGLLLIGFALTDGYDLGVQALLPFIARTDDERRLVINSIGPMWEGHQVWFILAGGAIFAAWPLVYAVSFSGLYLAMFVLLASMILRPVSFKYRGKRAEASWRQGWDWALFIGGFVPVLIFGVAVGNVLTGVPFHLDDDLRSFWDGGLFDLFKPLPLVAGLLSLTMAVLHGTGWLSIKIEHGPVLDRARRWGTWAALASVALFALGGLLVAYGGFGFAINGPIDGNGPSNPHLAAAVHQPGGWLLNYARYPWSVAAPIMGFVGPVIALWGIRARRDPGVFIGSSLATVGVISTVGLSMFPFILPSSTDPGSSLTVFNSSSSPMTLWIMLIATVVLLPIIMLYTSWVFKILFGRVTSDEVGTSRDFY